MGVHCKGCVWERVWRLKVNWRSKKFSWVAREKPSREVKHVLSTWLECEDHDRWWQLVFASVSLVRPSCKIPAKHSILPICHIWYTRSLPTLYIPTLPTYVEECFQRENPSHYPWEWEIVIPTILYTIHYDSPNTYHNHLECKVRFWCCWEVLEEAICLVDAIGLNCVIWRVREDKVSLSQLVARAWKARVHGVD